MKSILIIMGLYRALTALGQISRALSTNSSELIRRMPPIYDRPTADRYDYVVIGGGSGGSGTSVSSFCISSSSACHSQCLMFFGHVAVFFLWC